MWQMLRLKQTAPPTKEEDGKLWWVRDNHSHGHIVPVRVIIWRDEFTFNAVGYQRIGELGWASVNDKGVEWFGPIERREEA